MMRFLRELFFRPSLPIIEAHDDYIDKLTTGRIVLCDRALPDNYGSKR